MTLCPFCTLIFHRRHRRRRFFSYELAPLNRFSSVATKYRCVVDIIVYSKTPHSRRNEQEYEMKPIHSVFFFFILHGGTRTVQMPRVTKRFWIYETGREKQQQERQASQLSAEWHSKIFCILYSNRLWNAVRTGICRHSLCALHMAYLNHLIVG